MAVAICFRLPSFFLEIIDPDEWTYWISAREWLSGKDLYDEIIDIKPPGIFILFAGLLKISFGSFILARVWSALLLGLAAWALGNFSSDLLREARYRWPVALLFLCGFCYPFAQALNTEVFFVSFSCLGLYFLYTSKVRKFWIVPGFLFLGFAFIIKYTVLSDISVGFLLLLIPMLQVHRYATLMLTAITGAVIVLTPFALAHLYFFIQGNWDSFLNVVYVMPGKYAGTGSLKAQVDLFALFHFRFFWLMIPAYWGLYNMYAKDRGLFLLLLYWMLASWVMVVLSGKLHDHYWLQLMPVYSIAASIGMVTIFSAPGRMRLMYLAILIVFGFSTLSLFQKTIPVNRQIQQDRQLFNQHIGTQKRIWYAGMPAIFYAHNQSSVPTPYIHGSLLFSEKHIQGFGIKIPEAWQKAFEQSEGVIVPAERIEEAIYRDFVVLCRRYFYTEKSIGNGRYLIFSQGDDDLAPKQQSRHTRPSTYHP